MKKIVCLALCACSSTHHSMPVDGPAADAALAPTAVVAAGDFTAGHPGVGATVDVGSLAVMPNAAPQGAVGDDPELRVFGNELFVVNRADGNNVTILDAHTRALVQQLGTGAGSNPQDVAAIGDALYVPVFGGSGVAVLSRSTQAMSMIDLSSYDPDGKPNCVSAYAIGASVYIACAILDDTTMYLTPRGPGKVFVYDTATQAILHVVTMQNPNPFGVFARLPSGDLVIPTSDFAGGGCLEKIVVGDSPASGGCVVTNAQLGGAYIDRVDVDAASHLWLAVTTSDFMHGFVQDYDLAAGTLAAQPLTPASEVVVDVAACPDGSLVISDEAMNASGVRVYKNGAEVTSSALAVGLDTKSANALLCY